MKTTNYYIINDGWYDSNDLYHYGIKGMKWGVRRYQNPDESLTAAGKKKARQEYKEDNKKAFELGKEATVYGHAAAKSIEDTNGNRKLLKKRYEAKIDPVASLMDAFVAWKLNKEAFE